MLLFSAPLYGQKTDKIILDNEDVITGEIKGLRSGKLEVSTSNMSTVYIQWNHIVQVQSDKTWRIELEDGSIYYGQLSPADQEFTLTIVSDTTNNYVFKNSVVNIMRLKRTFWSRLNGGITVGFNYTKAGDVAKFDLSASVAYRSRISVTSLSGSSAITWQPNRDTAQRNNATLQYIRFMKKRWSIPVATSSEKNTELGIDLRLSGTLGVARNAIQTNENWLYVWSGLQYTREWVNGAVESNNNIELPLGIHFSRFRYDAPEMDLQSSLTGFMNLTTSGRYRVEFETTLMWKFIKNFTLNFKPYLSYDTKPPSESAAKSDFGIVFSLGWSFG
jgi:hypothetical protein